MSDLLVAGVTDSCELPNMCTKTEIKFSERLVSAFIQSHLSRSAINILSHT